MQALKNVQIEFGVTPAQAKILLLLAAKRSVDGALMARAGIRSNAKIAIHKLRTRLEAAGHELEIANRRGVGWEISEGDRGRIAEVARRQEQLADGGLAGVLAEMGVSAAGGDITSEGSQVGSGETTGEDG